MDLIYALKTYLEPEQVFGLFSAALQSQVTQFGIAFAMAAWIHSGRMKKEIASQLSGITAALNNLGSALREDLKRQSDRIETVEGGFKKLTSRVDKLEEA